MSSSVPNPIFSILCFFILTIVFFIIRFFTRDSMKLVTFVVYLLLLIVGEFFINMKLTSALCGTAQLGTAFFVTLVPWLIIFGLLNVMLMVFKGWKQPFSNTFGYLITRIMGINGLLDQILKSEADTSLGPAAKGLEYIYKDKSLFVNEIPLDDYDSFWKNMSTNYFKPQTDEILKNKLKTMVFVKDLVSEFVWFSLTGCLVTTVAYNYLVNNKCSRSVQELHAAHDAQQQTSAANAATTAAAPAPRVYTITE
jgi:hypothetical protein